MDDWARQLQWNAIAYAIVAACGIVILAGLYLGFPMLRQRWLPILRVRPIQWTGHEVFLAFCIFVGFPNLIVDVLLQMGFFNSLIGPGPDVNAPDAVRNAYGTRCSIISSPLILTFSLGFIFAVMFARTGSRPHHYGLTWSRWPANLAVGVVAFIAAWPVVIGIFALAVLVFPQKPMPHPLAAWEWVLFGFQTTLVAPLLEEITCRGILQSWLGRATLRGHCSFVFATLFLVIFNGPEIVHYDEASQTYSYTPGTLIFVLALAAAYALALIRLKRRFDLSAEETQEWRPAPSKPAIDQSFAASEEEARALREQARNRDDRRSQEWAQANATVAILGSAMFFAAMHSWPGPIALFPMGLVLGWLYRRTQSLLGPITFHMLFNLTTFIAFYGMVASAPAEQNGNAQTDAVRPSVAGSMTSSVPASQFPRRK